MKMPDLRFVNGLDVEGKKGYEYATAMFPTKTLEDFEAIVKIMETDGWTLVVQLPGFTMINTREERIAHAMQTEQIPFERPIFQKCGHIVKNNDVAELLRKHENLKKQMSSLSKELKALGEAIGEAQKSCPHHYVSTGGSLGWHICLCVLCGSEDTL